MWCRFRYINNTGGGQYSAKFYTSNDPVTKQPALVAWTQLGVEQNGVSPIPTVTIGVVQVGERAGTTGELTGKTFRAQLYNAPMDLGGALLKDFNAENWPETATNGATAVSSTTGETWTLNNSGALPAQIVGSPSVLFDGAAHLMRAVFAWVQPEMLYCYGKQITWTNADEVFDGGASAAMLLQQTNGGASPQIRQFAGAPSGNNVDWILNTYNTVAALFNGAASSLKIGIGAAVIGNAGVANAGGFTMGADGSGVGGCANIQFKEAIGRRVADSAALQAQIITLLNIINA
jgi:hypothetical protein